MAELTPVDFDPFAQTEQETGGVTTTPVDFDPFAGGATSTTPVEGDPFAPELDEVDEFLMRHPELSPTMAGFAGAGKALVEAGRNAPADALGLTRDIVTAITNPIETVGAIDMLIDGAISKALPGVKVEQVEKVFDATINDLKKTHGSIENINKYAINHPVRFATDLAGFLYGAGGSTGKVVNAAGKVSKLSKVERFGTTISKAAITAAETIDPTRIAGKGIAAVAKAKTPKHSIVKTVIGFDPKLEVKVVDELANSFVKKGLTVSRKSLARLDDDTNRIRGEIAQVISNKTAEGITIDTTDLVKATNTLIENWRKEGFDGDDLRTVQKVRQQFIDDNGLIMTPDQVQDWKKGANKGFVKGLADKAGKVEAKVKDRLRDASKSYLESLYPQLGDLNKDLKINKQIRTELNSAINRFEGKETLPVKGLVTGGIAGGITGGLTGASASTAAGGLIFGVTAVTLAKIATDPRVQIVIAKALHSANLAAAKSGQLHLVAQPAFQAGKVTRGIEEIEARRFRRGE